MIALLIGAAVAATPAPVQPKPVAAPVAPAQPAPVMPIATIAPPSGPSVLRAGIQIPVRMLEPLTTEGKHLREGQRFQIETSEAITLNGQVVIPAGSPGVGEITSVRNKGMWGKSGHLTAQILHVSVNGRQIRMSGTFDDKGVTGTAGVVGAAVLIPVAGFFMTGTSARIPLGAPVTGFVAEDVPVAFANAGPAPMVVPSTPR